MFHSTIRSNVDVLRFCSLYDFQSGSCCALASCQVAFAVKLEAKGVAACPSAWKRLRYERHCRVTAILQLFVVDDRWVLTPWCSSTVAHDCSSSYPDLEVAVS